MTCDCEQFELCRNNPARGGYSCAGSYVMPDDTVPQSECRASELFNTVLNDACVEALYGKGYVLPRSAVRIL